MDGSEGLTHSHRMAELVMKHKEQDVQQMRDSSLFDLFGMHRSGF